MFISNMLQLGYLEKMGAAAGWSNFYDLPNASAFILGPFTTTIKEYLHETQSRLGWIPW